MAYPQGCRELNEDLATDDLVRRLKDLAMAFQQMSQEEDNDCYIPLALYLSTDFFLEHTSRDVRLLVACAIADVFRVYAPNAPYQDPALIKRIFLFFIQQLKGLQDPKDATFKRYFYLLENLAWVKSFNICIELEDSQAIFCQLFALIFRIVNDNHSEKVKNFMLDMLTPLIVESDTVSMRLVELTLKQIVEPRKSQSKQSCWLATQILKKTSKTIEPYLVSYFNHALTHGMSGNSESVSDEEGGGGLNDKGDDSTAGDRSEPIMPIRARHSRNSQAASKALAQLCDLIYELNQVCPAVMGGIMPQLEYKIRSSDEKERCEFTKLLARLFSDPMSTLADEYPDLWKSFLGRFRDISVTVRTRCVQYSMHMLVNHPRTRDDITEQLRQRQHDPDENVRYEVVMAIISAAKKGIEHVNEDLLGFVRERTLDKKFKIRREALYGMAFLYKQCYFNSDLELLAEPSAGAPAKMLAWIKNKCMHNYYQTQLDDRLLVERILHMFLVPYSAPLAQRMKALYSFYATIDAHAARAFNQLLKQQLMVRKQVKDLLDVLRQEKSDSRDRLLKERVQQCARSLPEAVKAEEYLNKLCRSLELNPALRQHMDVIVSSASQLQLSDDGQSLCPPSCATIELSVKEVLKSLGFPVQTNSFYVVIKQLMERIAPLLIDFQGLIALFDYVHDSLLGAGELDSQLGLLRSARRGLQLILALSSVFPAIFYGKDIFSCYLLPFLWNSDAPDVAELVLQICTNIGGAARQGQMAVDNSEADGDSAPPPVASMPWWATDDVIGQITDRFILKASTTKQAKHAVLCLNAIIGDENERSRIFGDILDRLKSDYSLESSHFRIHLVTTGVISICGGHAFFPKLLRSIVHKCVVQNLLLKDTRLAEEIETLQETESQRETSNSTDPTVTFEFCSEEVKCKIEGIKLLVRWLYGLKLSVLGSPADKQPEEQAKYQKYCDNTLSLLRSIIQTDGDLNGQGLVGTELERAHLRLAAGLAMVKIVANDATTSANLAQGADAAITPPVATSTTSTILSPIQWHALGKLLLDPVEFVRERFALKLHKSLLALSLNLEFLALLSLGGRYEPNSPFRNRLRQYLALNLAKRRDYSKTKSVPNLKAVFPECVMPFVIHLLAHAPFFNQYDDVAQLQIVKDCLWFIMEPLVLKNDQFSFSFFKRTFENIKTCIDKVSPTTSEHDPSNQNEPIEPNSHEKFATMTNYKLYAACDLALGLVMSKTQNFLLKEYPVQPSLPGKYYTVCPLAKDNNLKSYLPTEMHFTPPKRCGLETEMLGKIGKNGVNGSSQRTSRATRTAGGSQTAGTVANHVNAPQMNQIVVLTTEQLLDESVIEAEPQILAISSDQIVKVVDSSTGAIQTTAGQPTILQISSAGSNQPITATVIQEEESIPTENSLTSVDRSEVVVSPEPQDKRLSVGNDSDLPTSKRARLDSNASSTTASTRSSRHLKNGSSAPVTVTDEEGQEELSYQDEESEPEAPPPPPPVKRGRGRPPKNPALIQANLSSNRTLVESPSNVRKSSRNSDRK